MIHRNNGAFTQEQRGEKMIETNSFTLLFLFSCCVSQSYYWVIDHEEIAAKTCLCTTDMNAFLFGCSCALSLSGAFSARQFWLVPPAACFDQRKNASHLFVFIHHHRALSPQTCKTSITNVGLTAWTNINLSDHSAAPRVPAGFMVPIWGLLMWLFLCLWLLPGWALHFHASGLCSLEMLPWHLFGIFCQLPAN